VEINSAWLLNFGADFMSRYNFECRFYTLKQLFDKTVFKLFGTVVLLKSHPTPRRKDKPHQQHLN